MAEISFKISKDQLMMIDKLSGRVKMKPSAYLEMVIESHVIQYQIHTCPECKEEYQGSLCPCKSSDRF